MGSVTGKYLRGFGGFSGGECPGECLEGELSERMSGVAASTESHRHTDIETYTQTLRHIAFDRLHISSASQLS